jgi:hypothetical protein
MGVHSRAESDQSSRSGSPVGEAIDGWHAFDLDRVNVIVFSPSEIPERARRELTDHFGGTVQDGVRLEEPTDLHEWPEGMPSPEVVLCRSVRDPNLYRAFKYRKEIDPAEYEETGKAYAVFTNWEKFAQTFIRLDEIASNSDADESPEVDEVLSSFGCKSSQSHGE